MPAGSSAPRLIASSTAAVAASVGALALAGWQLDLPQLNNLHPLLGSMSGPTALGFLLAGVALWLRRDESGVGWRHRLGLAASALLALLAGLDVAAGLLGWPVSPDHWLFAGPLASLFPGEMPFATALAFCCLGLALVGLDAEWRQTRPAELLAFGAALVGVLALMAYAYGFLSFFDIPGPRPLAFHTVALLLALAAGVLHARPNRGLMRLATSPRSTGVMVRRLLPAAIILPALTGWLILQGERAGLYPPVLGLTYFSLAIVAMFSALIWRTAVAMDRLDWKRLRAEDRIRALNADLERRVRDRTTDLEAANRELEAFSYSVSHDLRGPLRAIDGFSQVLLDDFGPALGDEGGRYLGRVREASHRMAELIDDLLSLSRVTRSSLEREPVDLTGLAEAVVADLQTRDPRPEMTVVIAPGLRVDADRKLTRVMLENLLGNAWKFTRRTAAPRVEVGAVAGARPELFIRDNGAGFDMQHAAKLFTAFERLHRQDEFSGSGIGLATVRRIVDRHGGTVRAEGVPNGGATIWFSLPEMSGGPGASVAPQPGDAQAQDHVSLAPVGAGLSSSSAKGGASD